MARRHGVKPALLYRWKKELGGELATPDKPAFAPVAIATQPFPEVPLVPPPVKIGGNDAAIEIRLANGRSVRVDLNIDTNALKRIVETLES